MATLAPDVADLVDVAPPFAVRRHEPPVAEETTWGYEMPASVCTPVPYLPVAEDPALAFDAARGWKA